jgi:hypothetical protein
VDSAQVSMTVLAGIYSITGKTKDAETCYIEVMNVLNEDFGERHDIVMVAANNAGAALFANGSFGGYSVEFWIFDGTI